ncbi:aldo/keto reductase [Aestuariivirga litoralis]|uniref:aldo/keto reductase n=1 Tax=Aestuariivirga litoralis TaxID=2650924 RepID=UPI0018C7E4C3|nr:aldo/keto reductase [Aestuariivirga litoralis]MBG1232327.1 aldo/keto reductase [Aestuariivirga litoralis]
MTSMKHLPRATLAGGLSLPRIVCGLWQVADIERDGKIIDPQVGADALQDYVKAGFTAFDMADHYGTSEIITGTLLKRYQDGDRPLAFTKWCPAPGIMTADIVRAGVQERLDRLGVKKVDLLQFHWWTFEHPAWLDALHEMKKLQEEGLIGAIGVTNFDAAHLALALADGIPIVSNQVSFSVLDRRGRGALAKLCAESGVKLLAYGTLNGGFLSEKWLGKPEPETIADWSKSKYKRFIDAAGGWAIYQELLTALSKIAAKHKVSLSNVATRWILEQAHVAAIIIGARIGENVHHDDNREVFGFTLLPEDHAALEAVFTRMTPIPGDCGDEYRKPPFLTASGDLSHHLSSIPSAYPKFPLQHRDGSRVSSGSPWEPMAGYSRAMRVNDTLFVSGTTATHTDGRCVAPGNAAAQTTYILDKIAGALTAAGSRIEDVVRTRIYIVDEADCEPISLAHGRVFGNIMPANTLVKVAGLIGNYEVEIEADALAVG